MAEKLSKASDEYRVLAGCKTPDREPFWVRSDKNAAALKHIKELRKQGSSVISLDDIETILKGK